MDDELEALGEEIDELEEKIYKARQRKKDLQVIGVFRTLGGDRRFVSSQEIVEGILANLDDGDDYIPRRNNVHQMRYRRRFIFGHLNELVSRGLLEGSKDQGYKLP